MDDPINEIEVELMVINKHGHGQVIVKGISGAFQLNPNIVENILLETRNKVDLRCRTNNVGSAIVNTETDEFELIIKDKYKK